MGPGSPLVPTSPLSPGMPRSPYDTIIQSPTGQLQTTSLQHCMLLTGPCVLVIISDDLDFKLFPEMRNRPKMKAMSEDGDGPSDIKKRGQFDE